MNKIAKILALSILGLMFILLFSSAWGDSATMDELAHIPSGYSYLDQKDYRLNPEHPPLIKDLSAIPLMFLGLNFPTDDKAWAEDLNGQWEMGRTFLYKSGNDADKIIRFSRLPIMLLALLFGWLLFKWANSIYGYKVGLLTLFFFAFSPTILAHSRYVTTDLGAAFGFFIAIASFVNFLDHQTRKNLVIAGIAFGVAMLLKFSLIILLPFYLFLIFLWTLLQKEDLGSFKNIARKFFEIVGKTILIGLIGSVLIFIFYQFHVWNYPVERQLQDTQANLMTYGNRLLADPVIWMSDKPILRPMAQYLLGLLMVVQRSVGGNTAYFLGTVSNLGNRLYFPLLYVFKEALAFHLLTLLALFYCISNIIKTKGGRFGAIVEWMRDNFALTAGAFFVVFYFALSIKNNLNIGFRHLMPVLPFLYFIVAREIVRWTKDYEYEEPHNLSQWIKYLYATYIGPLKRYFVVALLLAWMFLTTLITTPYYVSYFNALGGGTIEGYKVATDSNYDWGQDLKRLKKFVDENNIEKIGIDYFGGGNQAYYFGDKYVPWWSSKGSPAEQDGAPEWLAVSVNTVMGSTGEYIPTLKVNPADTYSWLKGKEPYARAGTSIFIYKF